MNLIQIMTPKVCLAFLHENDTVRQGLEIMKHHGYTAIPVLNDKGEYMGSVTEGDFLRHILAVGTTDLKVHEAFRIREIFRKDFCRPLNIRASFEELIETSLQQNFVPIIDDRRCLCGIVTRRSIIASFSSAEAPVHAAVPKVRPAVPLRFTPEPAH